MNLTDRQPFLQIPRVRQIRTTLRILWAAMVLSMGFVTYVLHHSFATPLHNPVLPAVSVALAIASFMLPEFLARNVRPASSPDPLDGRLGMLLITHILRFALTEAALLLLLFSYAENVVIVGCAYGVALGLMFFHFPNDTRIEGAGR